MKIRRRATTILCAVLLVCSMVIPSVTANAEEPKHMYTNMVYTDNGSILYSGIQTNFFSKTSPGLIYRSSKLEAQDLFGLTKEDLDAGAYPMMFVDDYPWESDGKWGMESYISAFNGRIMCMVDVGFWVYHGLGTWTEPVTKTLDKKVQLTFGMNPTFYDAQGGKIDILNGDYEFAVVGLRDGEYTLYDDVDADLRTVTIEVDKGSAFALVIANDGAVAQFKANQAGGNGGSQGDDADDWDEVPKTGDIAWDIELFVKSVRESMKKLLKCIIP